MSNYSIVMVHIGNIFYDYINDCIEQLLTYNNENIYLLISSSLKNNIKYDINLIDIEDIPLTEEHYFFRENTKLDPVFRGGFWRFATERFYYIYDFIYNMKLKNIIHLENDNLLYFNVNDYLSIFEGGYDMGFVFDNDKRCIPGVCYIKESQYLYKLISFLNDNIYKHKNDMESIADFLSSGGGVSSFPIIPGNLNKYINTKYNIVTKNEELYYNNFEKFNSIFDGACIGQYLGGIDPRNFNGNSVGFINETSIIDPSKLSLAYKLSSGRKEFFILHEDKEIKINNLHIHSKNLHKFKSSNSDKF